MNKFAVKIVTAILVLYFIVGILAIGVCMIIHIATANASSSPLTYIPPTTVTTKPKPPSLLVKQARLLSNITPDCDQLRQSGVACLACNLYHEARGEGKIGYQMVGSIVLNRVESQYYPDDICGVVWQILPGQKYPQFSWTKDGRPDHINDLKSWYQAVMVSGQLIYSERENRPLGIRKNCLWYHTISVTPAWIDRMTRLAQIGNHVVYCMSPKHFVAKN